MKLWRLPAARLPVTRRPFGGETVTSYTRRLAEANSLRPTAVLRALAEVHSSGVHLLSRNDAILNDAALDRLEALSGIDRSRLIRALPRLHTREAGDLSGDGPQIRFTACRPIPACSRCAAREMTDQPLVHMTLWNAVCRPHRRWLFGSQCDLSAAPEVLAAYRSYRDLLRRQISGQDTLEEARRIVHLWAERHLDDHPVLEQRWRGRADALGTATLAHPAVALPEAVALGRLMTDPEWRRDAALARGRWELGTVYERVAHATGASVERMLGAWSSDPISNWLGGLRKQHADLRVAYSAGTSLPWARGYRPLPPASWFAADFGRQA